VNYDTLPDGFSLYKFINLNTNKLKLWLNMASLPIFAALVVPAAFVVPLPARPVPLKQVYLVAACLIGFMLIHELIHGLFFRLAGGRPT